MKKKVEIEKGLKREDFFQLGEAYMRSYNTLSKDYKSPEEMKLYNKFYFLRKLEKFRKGQEETPVFVAKIDGKYVVNPEREQLAKASLDVIVAATLKDVMMVEGEADECQEYELIEAIKIAHEAIKVQCEAQLALAKLVGDKALIKREVIVLRAI